MALAIQLSGFADDATQAAKLDAIFRHFDTDKSGWISFDEFNAALVRLNFVGVQKEVASLFDRYDADGSGVLSYNEFSSGLFNLRPNPAGSAEVGRSCASHVKAHVVSLVPLCPALPCALHPHATS